MSTETPLLEIDLSVIIVSFNVKNYLLNCIRSVLKAATNHRIEIIVVDNASSDESLAAVEKNFPDVVCIQNNQNVGFGTACNQGLSVARGRNFLLLNPDVIVEESIFDGLLPDLEADPEIGLMGCKVLNEDGSLQLACRRSFPAPWIALCRLTGLSTLFPRSRLFAKYNLTYLDENERYELDAISGAFMLLTRNALQRVGGFDEHFFMYGEDLDLCYRVKHAGLKVVYNPRASIIHFKGRSFSRHVDTKYHFFQAMKIFVKKHGPNQIGMLSILDIAISLRYLASFLRTGALQFAAVLADYSLTVLWMEILARYRYGNWFPFPDMAYPIVYILLFAIQTPIYGWFGVYSAQFGVKRKLIAAAVISWLLLSVGAYFSKEFAFSRFIFLGLLVLSPASHIAWRLLARRIRKKNTVRSAVIVTAGPDFQLSDWIRVKFCLLHGMNLRGIVTLHTDSSSASSMPCLGRHDELVSVVRDHGITDVLIDADRMDSKTQLQLIQELKRYRIPSHRVSDAHARESILNEIMMAEEKTGLLFKIAKKFTDLLLYYEFRPRLKDPGMPNQRPEASSLWPLDCFLVGALTPYKFARQGFKGTFMLDEAFPQLRSDEDRFCLFLLYNRSHSYRFDKRILHLLLGGEV